MIASLPSFTLDYFRGNTRGIAGVRESRVRGTRGGSGRASSTATRLSPKPVARPGGFGCADRTWAGLAEAR
ncbi:MAG TPA: hypothetical protein VF178_06295, partial [Gemmatimonadaceae bacterium]